MQVILQFPRKSQHEERIKREVKEILFEILQECLMKNFLTIHDHRKGEVVHEQK